MYGLMFRLLLLRGQEWFLPTKPAPTKQIFLTGGTAGRAVIVSERVCRVASSHFRSGDSPRELGGDVAGVSSNVHCSDSQQLDAVKDSVLISRIKTGMPMVLGKAAMMKAEVT